MKTESTRYLFRTIEVLTASCLAMSIAALAPVKLLTPVSASNAMVVDYTMAITNVRSQAAKYIQAMSVVSSLGTTPVRTATDAAKTVTTITSLDSILKAGFTKRLTQIALDSRTFKQAIEIETARLGPRIFYDRMTSNPKILLNLKGAPEIAQEITRQVQIDAANLKKTSAYLRQAAVMRGRAQNNWASPQPIFLNAGYIGRDFSGSIEPVPVPTPQGGVGEGLILAAIVGAAVLLIGSYAAILSKGHEVPPATEDNPNPVSPVAKCIDEAIQRRDQCLDKSDVWGDLACAAIYLADRADCLFLPQA